MAKNKGDDNTAVSADGLSTSEADQTIAGPTQAEIDAKNAADARAHAEDEARALADEQARVAAEDTAAKADADPVDPNKAWFRANVHWVLAEMDHVRQGHDEAARAVLNP